jgi:hypothetical protein
MYLNAVIICFHSFTVGDGLSLTGQLAMQYYVSIEITNGWLSIHLLREFDSKDLKNKHDQQPLAKTPSWEKLQKQEIGGHQ